MSNDFPLIMMDLETTGVQPEHTNIIQIAAVRFNLESGSVDPKVFNMSLLPSPNRYWDEDTRKWWSSMPDILDRIWSQMRPPHFVLTELAKFAMEGQEGRPKLVAKPTSFEFPFLQSYFREFGVPNPFHYREAEDLNSFIRARYFPNPPPDIERELPFEGDAHDALYDVFHQIKVMMKAYEDTK